MTATKSAIIVGHGQPGDPDPAEVSLSQFAEQVALALPDWSIVSATLATPGALDRALQHSPANPVIYPMFMSQGWFTQVELPRRIGDIPIRMAAPFGIDPGLPAMAASLLQTVLLDHNWQAEDTQLFISGHGSGRSPNAARDTLAFADALSDQIAFAEQRVGFVEQAPFLTDAAHGLSPQAISLPFFAAQLGHVNDDLPTALNATGFKGVRMAPIGCAPQAPSLIAATLRTMFDND